MLFSSPLGVNTSYIQKIAGGKYMDDCWYCGKEYTYRIEKKTANVLKAVECYTSSTLPTTQGLKPIPHSCDLKVSRFPVWCMSNYTNTNTFKLEKTSSCGTMCVMTVIRRIVRHRPDIKDRGGNRCCSSSLTEYIRSDYRSCTIHKISSGCRTQEKEIRREFLTWTYQKWCIRCIRWQRPLPLCYASCPDQPCNFPQLISLSIIVATRVLALALTLGCVVVLLALWWSPNVTGASHLT